MPASASFGWPPPAPSSSHSLSLGRGDEEPGHARFQSDLQARVQRAVVQQRRESGVDRINLQHPRRIPGHVQLGSEGDRRPLRARWVLVVDQDGRAAVLQLELAQQEMPA